MPKNLPDRYLKSLEFHVTTRYDVIHNSTLHNAFIARWPDRIEENSIKLFNDYRLMKFENDAALNTRPLHYKTPNFFQAKCN